jgi:hypothetical protein
MPHLGQKELSSQLRAVSCLAGEIHGLGKNVLAGGNKLFSPMMHRMHRRSQSPNHMNACIFRSPGGSKCDSPNKMCG